MSEWHDHMGDNLADPLRNIQRACDQMLTALDEGRYNATEVHVRADLNYLRAEARRALRYQHQGDPMTCYICDPDNPDASPEGCQGCDTKFFTYIARVAEALQETR